MSDATKRIKVMDDVEGLSRFWNRAYGEAHAGKVYDAVIREDGWAEVECEPYLDNGHRISGAKFPPQSYEVIG